MNSKEFNVLKNQRGQEMPDGVFVFNKPLKAAVKINSDNEPFDTYIEGYNDCPCDRCYFINPWPADEKIQNSKFYAVRKKAIVKLG